MKEEDDGIRRSADFSKCGKYRYTLKRFWDDKKGHVLFVLLNPSTADAKKDDPTNRRGIGFAKRWGYGGVVFCNLFAYRTPYPSELKKAKRPVGRFNDKWLKEEARKADLVVASWGNHGRLLGRNEEVREMIKGMSHLGITKEGDPKHILYLRGDLKPEPLK